MRRIEIIIFAMSLFLTSCSGFLDLDPTDSISPDDMFSSEGGIEAYLAGLYYQLPIEDFNCDVQQGFWFNSESPNNSAKFSMIMTDEAIGSEIHDISFAGDGYNWWEKAYILNKDVNLLFSYIPNLTSVDEKTKEGLYGQAWFVRAFLYFELAKLYGGVPIITEIGDVNDIESLFIPRNTEADTWKYVLYCCDQSVKYFENQAPDANRRKASKWTALALKSRAALHAASLAKYWDKAPLSGEAVDKKYVGGMTKEDMDFFYKECIDASYEIIKSEVFSLYKPEPATVDEARENLVEMFQNPNVALNEVIFLKGYAEKGNSFGHNYDIWANPNQTRDAWPHPGRINPTLEFADNFECYSKPGEDATIVTTEDGIPDNSGYNEAKKYLHFDSPNGIYADKDARLWAYAILPGTEWKGVEIVMQGGIIAPDGTAHIMPGENVKIDVDGKSYFAYGAASEAFLSGFMVNAGNNSRTGLLMRKFLNPEADLSTWNLGTTDWIEFRYAEILLNYAEAVIESGQGDMDLAEKCMNETRRRAAFMTSIELTEENVQRERFSEFAFENKHIWDLTRRREYHEVFNNRVRKALVPIFDTRTKDYFFIRENIPNIPGVSWYPRYYYKAIPGISSNRLIQNPQR